MPPPYMFFLIVLLGIFIGLVHFGVLTFAFEKLGLSTGSAATLLFTSLIGSLINLPLCTVKSEKPDFSKVPAIYRNIVKQVNKEFTGRTLIAVNVGGAMVPAIFSIYLANTMDVPLDDILIAVMLVAAVCYFASRPLPGIGIGMPAFVAPITAALVALTVNEAVSAPLAYICGTLGVLIGADLLRLREIGKLGAPVAAIGGAGTFDGIFITGIVAVLLA